MTTTAAFEEAFGPFVEGGWQELKHPSSSVITTYRIRSARRASKCLTASLSSFLQAKATTARLYAEHLLSKAPATCDAIVEGADSVTALALEAF